MSEHSENRDKVTYQIKIEMEKSSSLEKIEQEIRARLKSHRVEELLSTPNKEVCVCLSVGPVHKP
jgi:hypothetical protein